MSFTRGRGVHARPCKLSMAGRRFGERGIVSEINAVLGCTCPLCCPCANTASLALPAAPCMSLHTLQGGRSVSFCAKLWNAWKASACWSAAGGASTTAHSSAHGLGSSRPSDGAGQHGRATRSGQQVCARWVMLGYVRRDIPHRTDSDEAMHARRQRRCNGPPHACNTGSNKLKRAMSRRLTM